LPPDETGASEDRRDKEKGPEKGPSNFQERKNRFGNLFLDETINNVFTPAVLMPHEWTVKTLLTRRHRAQFSWLKQKV